MKTKFLLSLIAVAFISTYSFADTFVGSTVSPLDLNTIPPLNPDGSNFDGGVTVFGDGGGAILMGANLDFPGGSIGLNPLATAGEEGFLDVSSATVGSSEVISVAWSQSPSGSSMIPVGSLLGGLPITTIGYEIGSANFGGNGLEWSPSAPFTIDAVEFNLLDVTGATLFTSTDTAGAVINPDGSLGYALFIGAGGGDLGGLGLAGATLDITITKAVPEPTSVALLSVLGLGLVSRRRR